MTLTDTDRVVFDEEIAQAGIVGVHIDGRWSGTLFQTDVGWAADPSLPIDQPCFSSLTEAEMAIAEAVYGPPEGNA